MFLCFFSVISQERVRGHEILELQTSIKDGESFIYPVESKWPDNEDISMRSLYILPHTMRFDRNETKRCLPIGAEASSLFHVYIFCLHPHWQLPVEAVQQIGQSELHSGLPWLYQHTSFSQTQKATAQNAALCNQSHCPQTSPGKTHLGSSSYWGLSQLQMH